MTGAGSGIGKAIAKAFAKKGAYLIINDLLEDRANSTRQEIIKEGGKAISIQCDVTSKEQLSEMVKWVIDEAQHIDVLVNNAGIFRPSEFFDLDEKDWDRTFAVNVKGMFLCSQLVSREMIKRNTGRILNLASITAKIPFQNYVDYCCTKAAVVQFTRVLALILAPHKITVNAIAPGSTEDTEMWRHAMKMNPQMKELAIRGDAEKFRIGIPLGSLVNTRDHASMMLYLASEEARHITGQTIFIDGGCSIF
ncbi:MAG: SDR family oxidoreductase [Deltaproteobacteria bacterium]|nr:SDR family oxidoreductase [Deltaproteobacteria bacterium]